MLVRTIENSESGNEQTPNSHGRKEGRKEFLKSEKWKFSRSGEPVFWNYRKYGQ